MISTTTVREPAQRIGEWTRIGQGPLAHARGTERDRIGSVKGYESSANTSCTKSFTCLMRSSRAIYARPSATQARSNL